MRCLAAILGLLLLTSCDYSMTQQPKYKTYAPGPTDVWSDGASARPLPNNVVAQSDLARQAAASSAPRVTQALLHRGEERFNIYCSPCHGLAGDGDGVIVAHGFPAPPSYHIERLLAAPAQHFYDVISHGYGVMYAYAARVEPEDRWAIVAYIRALQLSRHATMAETPEAEEKLP